MESISMLDESQSLKAMTPAPVPQLSAHASVRQPARTSSGVGAHDDGDRELLRRISGADRDAFGRLYLDYYKRLARFLVGRVPEARSVA
jgi:hypothetical protein